MRPTVCTHLALLALSTYAAVALTGSVCVCVALQLPDGRVISVGAERFQAAEALFRPELVDSEGEGLSGLVFRCIQEMDIDNRMALYQHIVLSGGSSMYPGLPSRLEADLRARYLQVSNPAHTAHARATEWRMQSCSEGTIKEEASPSDEHRKQLRPTVPRSFVTLDASSFCERTRWLRSLVYCQAGLNHPCLPSVPQQVLKGNTEALKKFRLRIEDPPRRRHMVFLGGAVLADIMKDKPEFWISKQEYEEEGFRCLKKCGHA